MLSVAHPAYVWGCVLMRQKNRRQTPGTYVPLVRNNASRSETRGIVSSTRAEKTGWSVRHALQSARIAPEPRPTCSAGLPVSTTERCAEHFSCQEMCCKRVQRNHKHNCTYIRHEGIQNPVVVRATEPPHAACRAELRRHNLYLTADVFELKQHKHSST